MRTGLTFEAEKAGLAQQEKEKIALESPKVGTLPWSKHGGIIPANGTWKAFIYPPLHWLHKIKIYWISPHEIMGKMLRDQQHS